MKERVDKIKRLLRFTAKEIKARGSINAIEYDQIPKEYIEKCIKRDVAEEIVNQFGSRMITKEFDDNCYSMEYRLDVVVMSGQDFTTLCQLINSLAVDVDPA